ncbi:MAG: HINT domain-containing protein, partial [Pseudomonadales bacterium]|nr:HINT domain-containing protein [Pseudomonadales bacterium]
ANLPKLPDRGGNDTGSGCSSFLGDTEVVTDSGLVPIKELDVNDLVLSRHDATYTDSFNPITKLHSRKVSSYYMIIVGTNIIYTTEEHPFWVQGEGWVPASKLEFGNAVATITGDTLIKGVSKLEKDAQVYNLTVANDHTYFIEEQGLWVHNSGACDIITQRFNQLLERIDDPNARERLLKDAEVSDEFREAFIDDPSLLESWKKLDDLEEASLRTDVDWLKRVNDWDSAGIQLSKNGDNLRLGDASGNPLGEFKNGSLIPENGRYQSVGTPVGDIVNGYQIVDNGGQLGIKRVPDESAYNASQLTELTQHPSAHVLERHGHDVADEALIKRANEGIAPDGSYIGNNPNSPPKPPYSSKFETPDQLKLALDNTRPGSAAFNAATTTNGVRVVRHELTGGASYGKGVPRDGNTFVTSTKVRAVYREVSPGNYQLITMFPDF